VVGCFFLPPFNFSQRPRLSLVCQNQVDVMDAEEELILRVETTHNSQSWRVVRTSCCSSLQSPKVCIATKHKQIFFWVDMSHCHRDMNEKV